MSAYWAHNRQYLHESCKGFDMSAPDEIDRRVLRVLQVSGRATFDDVAEQVGLSASAVLRRVRRMEQTGVIAGYRAVVPPQRVGLGLTSYVNVRLEKHTESHKRNPMDAFRAAVQAWPEVAECVALTGDMDYLLRVMVRDMDHYARFITETLLRHPSVQDCRTSFVLDVVKPAAITPV